MMLKVKKFALILPVFLTLSFFAVLTPSVLAAPAAADECKNTVNNQCLETNPLVKDIQIIVNFLSAGVGIIVTGAIIVGGIQYAAAGDNPTAVTAAKKRISNGLIALLAFALSFAFLNWLIPGGFIG